MGQKYSSLMTAMAGHPLLDGNIPRCLWAVTTRAKNKSPIRGIFVFFVIASRSRHSAAKTDAAWQSRKAEMFIIHWIASPGARNDNENINMPRGRV